MGQTDSGREGSGGRLPRRTVVRAPFGRWGPPKPSPRGPVPGHRLVQSAARSGLPTPSQPPYSARGADAGALGPRARRVERAGSKCEEEGAGLGGPAYGSSCREAVRARLPPTLPDLCAARGRSPPHGRHPSHVSRRTRFCT